MAEFTRDIKQLQKTASQQPQFAPPSQSLGGDIVNAIGTGLDFYAKGQAQEELNSRVLAQKEQDKRFAQGALGLRQLRQELKGQSISSTEFRKRENDYIKQFSPEMGMGILKETNTITGTTAAKVTSDIDKAEQEKVVKRQTLQESVASLAPHLNEPVDINADDATLNSYLLQGKANVADLEKRKSEAALKSTQLSNKDKEQALDVELYLIEYGTLAGNVFTKEALRIADMVDFKNPQQVQEARNLNNEFKRNFVASATQSANAQGIVVSEVDVTTQLANQMATFDEVERILSGKDIAEQSTNQIKGSINSTILYMQNSKNEEERKLGNLIALGQIFPENSALTGEFQKLYANTMIKGLGDSIFTLQDRATQSGTRDTQTPTGSSRSMIVDAFKFVKNVFKNASESVPQETREVYTNTILEDLQGSNAKRERILNNGALPTYVDAIGNGNPEFIIAEGKETEVLEGIMSNSQQFMRRAIPQILNQQLPMNKDFFSKALPPKGSIFPATKAAENYLDMVDPLTLKISWKNKAGISPAVRKYNKFVDDTFKSFEKLGASEDEIEYFRSQVLEGFNVAPTSRTDTN